MIRNPITKYQPFQGISLPDRQWPGKTINKAPMWMSTDLRDGNQSLIDPMSVETKLRFFKALVAIGFKEIEVGFPSASEIDYNFVRRLIDDNLIPDDVTIEVLTQARYELISKTVQSASGAKRVILHVYNPIAPSFRQLVYKTDKQGVKDIALQGTRWCKQETAKYPETEWVFQYSPEVFSSTELEFAKEVCDAVSDVWEPTVEYKMILNLPATVEMSTPNTYADQIEWMHRNLQRREAMVLSVHPHNDRGTAVAAAELAVMAGADRVEGCLFGNGERTGNVCLVTLALNLYTQGVDPKLDFTDIDGIKRLVEECNQLPVHPRHPYAGELVFTAFSGSHQDAINKGLASQQANGIWQVPYLPIDPLDLNRNYDAVVRVNSQSGKGGISFLLQQEMGLQLPRKLQIEFSRRVQAVSDSSGKEVTRSEIAAMFAQDYFACELPYCYRGSRLIDSRLIDSGAGANSTQIEINLQLDGAEVTVRGVGDGTVAAAVHALEGDTGHRIQVVDFHEHAIGVGTDVEAVCYIEVKVDDARSIFGAGRDRNIVGAAIKALLSGLNRAEQRSAIAPSNIPSNIGRVVA